MKTRYILLLLLVVGSAFAAGKPTKTFTGETVTDKELLAAWAKVCPAAAWPMLASPEVHAVIRRDALAGVMKDMRATVSKRYGVGVGPSSTGWEKRFNCRAFAMAFNLELQGRLMNEFFHVDSEAALPATFLICYHQRGGGGGHCIFFVLTDGGPVFLDPVAGELALSPEEVKSIYFISAL